MDALSDDLLSKLRGNPPAARRFAAKPSIPLGVMYRTEPLLFAANMTLAVGTALGFGARLACLFISEIFCIPAIILCATAVVGACGYILIHKWFPPDKPPAAPLDRVPNDKPWPKSQEVLDKFIAEEIKTPESGDGESGTPATPPEGDGGTPTTPPEGESGTPPTPPRAEANPAAAALKKHLEDPNEDGTRIGIFLFLRQPPATPEKICQFFDIVASLPEPQRMGILMAVAKVQVPGFSTGQYESMGAFAMTHESSTVRSGYMDLLGNLSAENLLKVLQQPVQWQGLPGNRAVLGMFIVSREPPTDERVQYIGVLRPKLTVDQLWDIKMDDGWTLLWSLLLFGDKELDGNIIRDTIKNLFLSTKEDFEEFLRHRPDGFSRANEGTHANESARSHLNDRMENMRIALNNYLRRLAEEHGVEYPDVEWTS
jgi:hypothetical protein